MSSKTIEQLLALAQQIKNETVTKANTATRVGGMMEDVVDKLEDIISYLETLASNEGALDSLTTTQKSNLVAAINEVVSGLSQRYTKSEVDSQLATIGSRVGNLGDLSTVVHSSLVSAINEVYGKVDDLNDIVNNLPSGGSSGGSGSSTPVVNNLTSTSTTSALSAYQGKVLKEAVDGKQPLLTQQDKQAIADLHQDPTVPTKTSELTNDAGFVTSSYHDSTKQNVLTDADKKAIADLHQDPVYTGMTQSTATGGTSTTNQLISAKVLNDTIDNKMGNVNTVLETLLGTGGA